MENSTSAPTGESLNEAIEQNGIKGLATEMQKYFSTDYIVTANGNELIINDIDPDAVNIHKNLINDINHFEELDLMETEKVKIQRMMLEEYKQNHINKIRNSPETYKQFLRKAKVKKITHQFGGIFAFSFDFE